MEDKEKEMPKVPPTASETEDLAIDQALKSFCCYLYVGKGHPHYKARPWNDDDNYPIVDRLRSLDLLAENKKTELVPIDKIKLAMDSELIQRPETLMFALAMCARQKKSEKLRAAAYYFLAEHCKQWKYFVLFIKYASIICKMQGPDEKDGSQHIGWGHGWKNAVNKWYLTQSPTALAQLVTYHKGNCGWTHRDILMLSHPNTSGLEVEKRAIVCYVMRGLKQAEVEYGEDLEAKKILEFIRSVETGRRSESKIDEMMVSAGHLTVDRVHPKALKKQRIWNELLPSMDIRDVLKNLPKLNDLGFVSNLSKTTMLINEKLINPILIQWNKILPADILAVLNRYEPEFNIQSMSKKENEQYQKDFIDLMRKLNIPEERIDALKCDIVSEKPKKSQEPVKVESGEKKVKAPPKEPSPVILDALRQALTIAQTVDITKSSKRKYLVSVRLPGQRKNNPCVKAALAIALPLFHREELPDEEAVTLIGFEPRCGHGSKLEITKETPFSEAIEIIFATKKKGTVESMPLGALGWAHNNKKKYDVFINVTNEQPPKKILNLMAGYKQDLDVPNARLINVIINPTTVKNKAEVWDNCLTIEGFDSHVPWIIEAYVRGLF